MDLSEGRVVKGIVFDLDGTLVDSVDSIWRSSDYVLRSNGYRGLDREDVVKVMGKTIFDLFLSVEPRLSPQEQHKLFEEYRRTYMNFIEHTKLIPKVREILLFLRSRRLKMAVVTTKSRENAEKILSFFGIRSFFDLVIGFEDVREHKPSAEPIMRAAEGLGLQASELVVVGDTEVDIRAGREAGALTVAVKTGVTPLEKIIAESPNFLIESVSDLPEVLMRNGIATGE
ncbi:MAG: HAD-IA family hydrolase [Candidatus Methanomethylicaceae archaeon]|nr:HAD-IA family hydrolase [Candidatus Verstraetearchaeota archaeon]